MFDDSKYKQTSSYEAQGGIAGPHGVKVYTFVRDREITPEEQSEIGRLTEAIAKVIQTGTVKANAENVAAGHKEVEDLLKCFGNASGTHIEIPNGYCNQPCCINKPWLKVATARGYIIIGWRKRVIEISWDESFIKETASDLFPDEDVTKSGKLIHAWGYEKAKEYLAKLLGS
jgi:hypothetical protein